jgi:predicted PurR-regulated permease PerM
MNQRFRKPFLIVMVVVVSVAFLAMIRSFLMTVLMAAIFSGLAWPLYARIVRLFGGRRGLASAATLLLMLVMVFGPLFAILGLVVNEAMTLTNDIGPTVQRLIEEPTYLEQELQGVPWYEQIEPYMEQILTSAGDLVNAVGGFLVTSLSSATRGTVTFVLHFFILLYAMFFFLTDGPRMRDAILAHLPLSDHETQQMKDRFMSVTRATVRGTIVIGIIQGVLAGLAFWIAGIPHPLFWTVVMVVLSILPVIGSAIVWVPACVILIATGHVLAGVVLAGFCALIVGSVDNVLRPRLVGHDTRMHDLVILFSTLGGIITFGPIGFIVGPILAGLFITSWEIFGLAHAEPDAGGPTTPPSSATP